MKQIVFQERNDNNINDSIKTLLNNKETQYIYVTQDFYDGDDYDLAQEWVTPMIELCNKLVKQVDAIVGERGDEIDAVDHEINGSFYTVIWKRSKILLQLSHEDRELPMIVSLHYYDIMA